MADNLVVYGACCSWWDTIDKADKLPGPHPIPCCPHCKSVLLQMDESQWWAGVDNHMKETGDPTYKDLITWMRGKCFPSYVQAEAAYVQSQEDN